MERWEEELRGNPEDWVPVKARVSKNPGIVYSVRFNRSEVKAIRQAAKARGLLTTEFIRQAAVRATSDTSLTQGSVAIWQVR